jgi:flagellar assembly factor FliW
MLETRALTTADEFERLLPAYRDKDVILFEEGLIGFPGAKRFILIESESLSPFRVQMRRQSQNRFSRSGSSDGCQNL